MANRKLERNYNAHEYRILRTAAKTHICGLGNDYHLHFIERGERHWEYLQMPGHDWNMGGKAPRRWRVCLQCIPGDAF
jgi:hypothetical protein